MRTFGFVWGDVFLVRRIFPKAEFFAYGFALGHFGICLVRLKTNRKKGARRG